MFLIVILQDLVKGAIFINFLFSISFLDFGGLSLLLDHLAVLGILLIVLASYKW